MSLISNLGKMIEKKYQECKFFLKDIENHRNQLKSEQATMLHTERKLGVLKNKILSEIHIKEIEQQQL